jgi:hypothetical protein
MLAGGSGAGIFILVSEDTQPQAVCPSSPYEYWDTAYGTVVTITDSTVVGNSAHGSGLATTGASGGGVYLAAGGLLVIDRSNISGNSADFFGGGLAVGVGASTCGLVLSNSEVRGNVARRGGAQIFMDGTGDALFQNTTFGLRTNTSQVREPCFCAFHVC